MTDKKINIVIVNTNDKMGGAAIAASRIHQSLNRNNITSKLLVRNKLGNDKNTVDYLKVLTHGSFILKIFYEIYFKLLNIYRRYFWQGIILKKGSFLSDWGLLPIKSVLKEMSFDILHLQWISGNFIDISHIKYINKPIVWTLHDAYPFTGGCHIFYECKRYEINCTNCPLIINNSKKDVTNLIWQKKRTEFNKWNLHIVATSRWMFEAAKKSSLFGSFPIHLIPNPIDTKIFKPIDKKEACYILNLNPTRKYLLFGAMKATSDQNKGYHFLKDALQILKSKTILELELLIFGHNTYADELQDLGYPVHFFGSLEGDISLACIYSAADVTIVPSMSENLPNLIMESFACGTPSVAFKVGGNLDIIDHKLNGYLSSPFETEDLAMGIKWCIENNSDNKLSTNARQKVLETYSEEIIAKQYYHLYNDIVKDLQL